MNYKRGIINDTEAVEAKVKAEDFETFGRKVCPLGVDEIQELYPSVAENDRPYFCLDLVYEYTLLVDGFGILHPFSCIHCFCFDSLFFSIAQPLFSIFVVFF